MKPKNSDIRLPKVALLGLLSGAVVGPVYYQAYEDSQNEKRLNAIQAKLDEIGDEMWKINKSMPANVFLDLQAGREAREFNIELLNIEIRKSIRELENIQQINDPSVRADQASALRRIEKLNAQKTRETVSLILWDWSIDRLEKMDKTAWVNSLNARKQALVDQSNLLVAEGKTLEVELDSPSHPFHFPVERLRPDPTAGLMTEFALQDLTKDHELPQS